MGDRGETELRDTWSGWLPGTGEWQGGTVTGGGGVVGYLGEGYRRQVNSGGMYNDGTISRAERGGVEGQ